MASLYHTEVEFPTRVVLPEQLLLTPTDHTVKEAKEDYDYIEIEIPDGIMFNDHEDAYLVYKTDDGADVREGHVFELESENGTITKVVVRCDYDIFFDIIVAIDMESLDMDGDTTPKTTIKTVYLNPKDDQHDTLDESRYDKPDEEIVTV